MINTTPLERADGRTRFARRTLLALSSGLALSTGLGFASPAMAAQPDSPAPTELTPSYDQAGYRFAPLKLRCGAAYGTFQARLTPTSPWIELGKGRSIDLTPTWSHIGADFRKINPSGKVLGAARLVTPTLTGLDPAAYGAVGDGIADDTAALNATAAAAAAANDGIDLNGRIYRITSRVRVTNGVTAVFGGTVRQASTGTVSSPLYLAGRADGLASNVSGCVISDVTIEMTTPNTGLGIATNGAAHIAIVNCTIGHPAAQGSAISFRHAATSAEDLSDIVIRGNRLTLMDDVGTGMALRPPIDLLGQPDMPSFWRAHWTAPPEIHTLTGIQVLDNEVSGGYYGIALANVQDYLIEGNTVSRNTRNISLQQNCSQGQVRLNDLSDSISSSIHLAYASNDNVIENNTITTTRSVGEGLLQAYVGSSRNTFRHNSTMATVSAGPKWHVYVGVHANDNRVEANTLQGNCSRAYIAVEAAWDSTNPHPVHRAIGFPSTDNFASQDLTGVQLVDNEIDPTTPSAEPICLADITDANGTFRVVTPVVTGNHLTGQTSPIIPHTYVG